MLTIFFVFLQVLLTAGVVGDPEVGISPPPKFKDVLPCVPKIQRSPLMHFSPLALYRNLDMICNTLLKLCKML